MPRSSIITNNEYVTTSKTLIKDWHRLDVEVVITNPECSIQETLVGKNLLSLPIRKTHGQKPIVDYL